MLKKSTVLFLGAALVLGFALLISLLIFTLRREETTFVFRESAKTFSDDAYEIFFVKNARGSKGDGLSLDVYSVDSTGASEKLAKPETTGWTERAAAYGVAESMGSYIGDTKSPDGKRSIAFEYPLGGWLLFFDSPRVYIEEGGQRSILPKSLLGEFEWLPDSKRIVFASKGKIGIIDVATRKYAYLADGVGWLAVEKK